MPTEYKNIVFTKHASERMSQRSITTHSVWETVTYPDTTNSDRDHSTRFIKTKNGRKYFVVAKYLPKERKQLVVSTWVRGEDDRVPILWQLITLPFKLLWKAISFIIRRIASL